MPRDEPTPLDDFRDIGTRTVQNVAKSLAKAGIGSAATTAGSLGGSFGPTAGMAGGNPGLASIYGSTGTSGGAASGASAGSTTAAAGGMGTMVAGGAFAGLAAFVASKLITNWGRDNPALTFMGGTGSRIAPIEMGSDRGESSKTLQTTATPSYTSTKFGFTIGAKDIPGSDAAAKEVGQYFDQVFTKMQANTSVDINKIVEHAWDLTDWDGGGPEEMINGVVNKVASGIQTGTPLAPYYSEGESKYATGMTSTRPKATSTASTGGRNSDYTLNQPTAFNPMSEMAYAPIQNIGGDPNFTVPGDVAQYSPGAGGASAGSDFVSDPNSIFGSQSGDLSALAASNPLAASAIEGISQQEAQREKIKELYAPYYDSAVEGGLPQLQALAQGGDVDYTPSKLYEYSKMRGERNIRRSQASKGLLGSSGTSEKMSDLNSGLAAEEMDRLYQGQLSRVQIGAGAADAVGAANRSIGSNVSGLYSGLGSSANYQAQSAGASSGQATQSAYQGIASGLMGLAQYMEVG